LRNAALGEQQIDRDALKIPAIAPLPSSENRLGACTRPCNRLPSRWLWYGDANAVANAVGYATHYSRSHDAMIRVYDDAGKVIESHEYKGDFKEW
jgi:hypothetical protein